MISQLNQIDNSSLLMVMEKDEMPKIVRDEMDEETAGDENSTYENSGRVDPKVGNADNDAIRLTKE